MLWDVIDILEGGISLFKELKQIYDETTSEEDKKTIRQGVPAVVAIFALGMALGWFLRGFF